MSDQTKTEKEILGLSAKLRWEHVPEHLKEVWRERIEQLKRELNAPD